MKSLVLLSTVPVLVLAACGGRTDPACTWRPIDAPSRLDLQDRRQRLHLMDEALSAEDSAIRFADTTRGHRSGNFAGNDTYRETREQCMAMLFTGVAKHHGVSIEQVRGALAYRRASVDYFVLGTFAVFYILVASAIVRWMFRGVFADNRWRRVFLTTVAACATGVGGVLFFELFAGAVEMIRIGNTHMSYRVGRDPWSHHRVALLVGNIALFAFIAAHQNVRNRVNDRESGPIGHAV